MAHLTEQDRARIVSLLAERRSLRQVAIELGKSPSTVAREILKRRVRSEETGRFVHYNKRQSIYAIMAGNADRITVNEKTLYRYHALGVLRVGESAFPRKQRLKPRKAKPLPHLVDGKCRAGRTYDDYQAFVAANGDGAVVQMDTVEGVRGGKVLLTLHFVSCHLQLAFIRDRNTAASVAEVFAWLRDTLGDAFARLFPVVLTDNASPGTRNRSAALTD